MIKTILKGMSTDKHKAFLTKLIPNIDSSSILGIKNPNLKALAKKLAKENPQQTEDFLLDLPHEYLEENMLHAFLISNIKDFTTCVEKIEAFSMYIDNWAVCDSLRPAIFKKYTKELYPFIEKSIDSNHDYTKRMSMGFLLSYYLNENFAPSHLDLVASNNGEDYYVKMMVAWYFSMALAKQYETIIKYIENPTLEKWTHNKAIQKAIESRQVSQERKDYLRSLKL